MAKGRGTPPLFEALGDRPPKGIELRTRPVRGAGGPPAAAAPVAGREDRARPGAHAPAETAVTESWLTGVFASGRSVRVPVSAMFLGAAAVVIAFVVIWVIAYRLGVSAGEAKMEPFVGNAPGGSLRRGADSGADAGPGEQMPGDEPPARPGGTADTDRQTESRAPAPADPRVSGCNYLALATLSAADARAAVEFLADNGIGAFAIPLESTGRGANNRGPHRVYSSLAIPSDQYSQREAERQRHIDEIRRLGRIWQEQHGGPSDFPSPYWELYKP